MRRRLLAARLAAPALLALVALLGILAAPEASAQEIRLEIDKGLKAKEVVDRIHAATAQPILYPPAELDRKAVRGSFDVSVPRENAFDFLVFVLSTCDLEVRRYSGPQPLAVVVPERALTTDFRLTGLEVPLRFARGPGAWSAPSDLAESLEPATVAALVEVLAQGDGAQPAWAATLLGYVGPRQRTVVDALAAALAHESAGVRLQAAWALEQMGHAAKPALPALRTLRASAAPAHAEAIERALRNIEASLHPALLDPALAVDAAPPRFQVRFETTKGEIVVDVDRAWAPKGADRFYNLVRIGFFDGAAFFRVIDNFVAQFGKHADPRVNRSWYGARIADDPIKQPNKRGYLSFAMSEEPGSRTTQIFINLQDNPTLDDRFVPFAVVSKGLDVVDQLFSGYRDQPDQGRIHFEGNEYLKKNFPKLDSIEKAEIVK